MNDKFKSIKTFADTTHHLFLLSTSAKTIREFADKSIGVASHGALVKDSARKALECTARDEELTKALLELETSIHKEAAEIVASMPGIGLVTASQFMAEVEDISRFETYQKLIAFMGTDQASASLERAKGTGTSQREATPASGSTSTLWRREASTGIPSSMRITTRRETAASPTERLWWQI